MTSLPIIEEKTRKECYSCGTRFSWASLGINLLLAILKAAVGTLAGSRALMASALYSINDVLSAIVVLTSLKIAKRPANAKHSYGYGAAEFIAMGLVSLILAGGVVFVLVHSIAAITEGIEGPPHLSALFVALLTVAINLVLAERGFCAARKMSSPAVQTSAHHNHCDAISSLAVAIGIGAALLGFHAVDAVVAIFETVHIMWLAGVLFGRSTRGLMDTSLPRSEKHRIHAVCEGVPGVHRVLGLRSRRLGSRSWVDIVISVPEGMSVRHASRVAAMVRTAVMDSSSHVEGVHCRFRQDRTHYIALPSSTEGTVS